MKKVFLSLFMVFSLLVAPVASAAGFSIQEDNCHMSGQAQEHSEREKQDDGKTAEAGHHCCCAHVSFRYDPPVKGEIAETSSALFISEDVTLSSAVIGPPLKPPSYV